MPLIDLPQFCRELPARRNKAAMLLVPDLRELRAHAARTTAAAGAFHLDLLDHFQATPDLTAKIGAFGIDEFLELVASQREHPLLVVSGIEFLLAIWISQGDAREVKLDLCRRLELWERIPAFLIVTAHSPVLATYQPDRHTSGPLVMELSHTAALT